MCYHASCPRQCITMSSIELTLGLLVNTHTITMSSIELTLGLLVDYTYHYNESYRVNSWPASEYTYHYNEFYRVTIGLLVTTHRNTITMSSIE